MTFLQNEMSAYIKDDMDQPGAWRSLELNAAVRLRTKCDRAEMVPTEGSRL